MSQTTSAKPVRVARLLPRAVTPLHLIQAAKAFYALQISVLPTTLAFRALLALPLEQALTLLNLTLNAPQPSARPTCMCRITSVLRAPLARWPPPDPMHRIRTPRAQVRRDLCPLFLYCHCTQPLCVCSHSVFFKSIRLGEQVHYVCCRHYQHGWK